MHNILVYKQYVISTEVEKSNTRPLNFVRGDTRLFTTVGFDWMFFNRKGHEVTRRFLK